jgi:ribosomal protein S18 acetylase RimI-like enzyme
MDPRQDTNEPRQQPARPAVDPIPFTSGVLLTEGHLPLVADFTCAAPGMAETRFEQDVSMWLKDPQGGALMAVRLELSEVRLFFCPRNRALMGYGAIGIEEWRFPDGSTVRVWVLQYAGVHTNFRHQANIDSNARFGRRLLAGMLREVQIRGGCEQIGLFVDPENPARARYRDELLFRELDVEQDGDRRWVRMVRPLHIS